MTMKKMNRVQYSAYGSADVLTYVQTDLPEPNPGELRLKVEAIGSQNACTGKSGISGIPGTGPSKFCLWEL
jgi:hypothetical protein